MDCKELQKVSIEEPRIAFSQLKIYKLTGFIRSHRELKLYVGPKWLLVVK